MSTIARKNVMAVTGLFLCSFLVVHLLGNVALFLPEGEAQLRFNAYARLLAELPGIGVAAALTYAAIVLHAVLAALLTRDNLRAAGSRPLGGNPSTSPWYSRSMGILGVVLLVFLVVHLRDFWYPFKFGDGIGVDANGERDLYSIVAASFASPGYVALYTGAMAALGLHLYRGVYHGLRSLGLYAPAWAGRARRLSQAFALVVAIGFAAMPLFVFFFRSER